VLHSSLQKILSRKNCWMSCWKNFQSMIRMKLTAARPERTMIRRRMIWKGRRERTANKGGVPG